MKNLIKEFIIEEHSNASREWKAEIEKKYPDLFKSEIEVGKWYKHKSTGNAMLFLKDTSLSAQGFLKPNIGYGVDYKGNWTDNVTLIASTPDDLTPATDKEVKDALIAEAKKRGFKNVGKISINIRGDVYPKGQFVTIKNEYEFRNFNLFLDAVLIFHDGKWATIIEEEEKMISLNEVTERIQTIENELQSLKELLK